MEGYQRYVDYLPVLGPTASSEGLGGDEMREEHIRLGWLKQEGKLAEAILTGAHPDELPEERISELQQTITTGKEAYNELVLQNLGLAKRFASPRREVRCSREDLFQVAATELSAVCHDYDPSRGTTVSEFGSWRIRRAVSEFIASNGFPMSVNRETSSFALDALEAQRSTHPEFARKMLALKYPERKLETPEDLQAQVDHYNRKGILQIPKEFDKEIEPASPAQLPLRLIDTWLGRVYIEPGETDIFMLLNKLEPRDRQVVYMCAIEGCTATEVGVMLGVSNVRAGQIYKRGLKQLRLMLQNGFEHYAA